MVNVIQKDGRSWNVDESGITSLARRYTIELSSYLSANGEVSSWPGIPAIGARHPFHNNLSVISYDVQEGEGNEKKLIDVTVNYSTENPNNPVETEISSESAQVEQWGWESGSSERELLTDYTSGEPQQVANSVGDPFETAPTVATPAPVFTKVLKFRTRQDGWNNYMCTINSADITIGGIHFPKWTLLCDITEQRIFGDGNWRYRYTVKLSYKSNKVLLKHGSSETEVGWNIAIADAGMRQFDENYEKILLITDKDSTTNERYVVSSPALLDGKGHRLTDIEGSGSEGAHIKPYNVMFYAYPQTRFPNWFYSEPL